MTIFCSCSTHVGNPGNVLETKVSERQGINLPEIQSSKKFSLFFATSSATDQLGISLFIQELRLKAEPSAETANPTETWLTIPFDSQKPVELSDLDALLLLAESDGLAPGNYTELRIVLNPDKSAQITEQDNSKIDLKVPSGSSSGIKIKADIRIDSNQSKSYIVDFDLSRSIKKNGNSNNYRFSPVLRLVDAQSAKPLEGQAEGTIVCVYQKIEDADDSSECPAAIATTQIKNSRYKIPFLAPGSYDLRLFKQDGSFEDRLAQQVE